MPVRQTSSGTSRRRRCVCRGGSCGPGIGRWEVCGSTRTVRSCPWMPPVVPCTLWARQACRRGTCSVNQIKNLAADLGFLGFCNPMIAPRSRCRAGCSNRRTVRPMCCRYWRSDAAVADRRLVVRLDHDALAGAFLGGLDGGVDQRVGDARNPFAHVGPVTCALGTVEHDRLAEVRGFLLHHPEAVVTSDEHVGADLRTDAVAGAEVLVDPDHQCRCCHERNPSEGWSATPSFYRLVRPTAQWIAPSLLAHEAAPGRDH